MKKRQMQKWILAFAAMILVCFVFYKVDFFHAEDVDTVGNESLGFSDEEDESDEGEESESGEDEGEKNESGEYEEDIKEIWQSPDDESQDNGLDLFDASSEDGLEMDTMNGSAVSVKDEHGVVIKSCDDIFEAWEIAQSRKSATTVTLMEKKDLQEGYLHVKEDNNITLELADNVTLEGQNGQGVILVEGGTFILNGGNGSVINTHDPVGAILVKNGEFILKSGKVVGRGTTDKDKFYGNLSCGMQIQGGTIYIDGGEIIGEGEGSRGNYIVGLYVQGGIVNINGGYITGKFEDKKHGVGIYVTENDNDETKNGIVNISGGKIEGISESKSEGVSGYGVCMDRASVTVNISGGIIIGKSNNYDGKGIFVTGGVANISGGTIAGYSESKRRIGSGVDVSEGSEAFIYGGVIIGSGRYKSCGVSVSGSNSYAEIKGGIITGNDSETDIGVNVGEGGNVIISGGDVTGIGGTNCYGVYVSAANAEIKGGIITGTSNANSYGVSVRSGGTADIYNGEIIGSSNSCSYGVNVSGEDGKKSVVNINGGFIGKNNTYHYVAHDDINKIIVKEGSYTNARYAYGVKVSKDGVVNINTGEISGSGTDYGYGINVDGGTAGISGGNITGTGNSFDGYGINVNGGIADISGGNITGTGNSNNGYGIKVDGGTTDISGGVFTGKGVFKDGYGMRVEGGTVQVIHGTSTPYGGMFIGNGSESGNGYGLNVQGGDVTLCTGVYKGSTYSVYTKKPDEASSFTDLLKDEAGEAHAYRYVDIPADEVSITTERDSIAVPDSIVINGEWIYDNDNDDKISKFKFREKSVTVMKIPLSIEKPTVELKEVPLNIENPTTEQKDKVKVEYGYSDKVPVICIEAKRLIRDESKEITYQWYDSDGPISGATEETYVPIGLDAGNHFFKCEVTCDQYKIESYDVEIEVEKKLITATITIKDKEYDGSNKADIDNIILSGVVGDDDVALAYNDNMIDNYNYSEIEASFETDNAGDNISVSVDENRFMLNGEDKDNYFRDIIVKEAKIEPRKLKLTVSVKDKVYDGSCYVDIDKDTFVIDDDSIVAGDVIALAIKEIVDDKDYILEFSDKNVNEDIPIKLNKNYIQLTNNENGNYSLIYPYDVTADITPIEVGLTVVVKDEEIGADQTKKSDNSATIIFADFDKEKLAACDVDIVDLADFSNINATFESVELGKHTINFDSDFYLIDSNSGKRTDNYILIPNVMASIYKKGASSIENPVPEDNSTSTSTEEPIKINSILSNLDKNPFTGINDHLLYFTVILVLFGGTILIIHFTGKRKKGKNNSKS